MALRSGMLAQGAWVFAGQVLSALAILASLKLWAVYLSPSEVGTMGLVIGLASILSGIASGPLTQSILVSYAGYAREGQGSTFRAVGWKLMARVTSIVVTTVLIIGVPLALMLQLPVFVPVLVAGLFAADAWRGFEISLLAAARRQKLVGIIQCADAWLRFAFLWLALLMIPATAYTAIGGNLAGAAVLVLIVRLTVKLEAQSDTNATTTASEAASISNRLVSLSKPLFPAALLANVTEMLNRYLIAATIGLAPAGLFVISYGLVKRPYGLLNAVTDWTMRPMMAKAIAENNSAEVRQARRIWLAAGGGFALLGVALFFLLREPIVHVILSPEYASTAHLLPWLALAIALFNIANIFGGFSLTMGDTRAVLINNAVGAVTGAVLTVVLSLQFGLLGAAWGLLGGYVCQLATSIATAQLRTRRQSRAER
ncbi:lipopolysaccharide biosynthesis protein [Hyphomicrobium sp. D-2]|uniref:lipopolysaccharide biosynthesis protein n=1 Tax=Hyphomicrobium sp. D-2 TaxID=3041621 RepID=UPI002456A72C|nr:lipopolysaccharide biosynthesis protein [Hyphomicrobium sp. D-2]MDH4980683.1 lipopolysaccharide biosynthesis protein [Hyphomicrobium sp. D-2]